MFRVFAKNETGGVSVILDTAGAAIRKAAEFRDAGFQSVSLLNPVEATIEEAALAIMAEGEGRAPSDSLLVRRPDGPRSRPKRQPTYCALSCAAMPTAL